MKFVAVYKAQTGEITTVCALPQDPYAPVPGMHLAPGERLATFDAPDELGIKHETPDLHARLDALIRAYRIDGSDRIVART